METRSCPTPDEIRTQLEKVVTSKYLRSSELAKRFLSFVVAKTLDGKDSEIKEYSIGAEAFGRGLDFDPRIDSVVRVVARRVRDRLAEYYKHEGKRDLVVIQVPTGSYIPIFSAAAALEVAEVESAPSPPSPLPRDDSTELTGKTISHYEVLELLARGGSGLVYRAEDLRLKRGVAFKILFPEYASNPQKLERFLFEARAASAVCHPNVCCIYDVGDYFGRAYIVMELIEGKTLDQFIDAKPLPVETLLDFGLQISDALVTVHAQGFIHRDVRAANVIVNLRNQVKLLDFSAAEAVREPGGAIAVIGQSADPLDARTAGSRSRADIMGLGALLYQMATGERFSSRGYGAIELPNSSVSEKLSRLIEQAMKESPNLTSVLDIQNELLRIKRAVNSENAPAHAVSFKGWKLAKLPLTWAVVVVGASLLLGIYAVLGPSPQPKILSYTQLTHDGQGKLGAFSSGVPAPLLTDGSRLYFNEIAGSQVVLREVSTTGGESVPLHMERTEPMVLMGLSRIRSELLAMAFFERSAEHQLFSVPQPDGAPKPLGNLIGHDGAWSPDGTKFCYANSNHLHVSTGDGTNPKMVATLPGLASWLRWSPDSKRLRATVQASNGATSLWEVPLQDGQPRPLFPTWEGIPAECCGSWSPDGQWFVFQSSRRGDTELWISHERRGLFGHSTTEPHLLTEGPLQVWAPTFAADGKTIIAVVQQQRGELVRYDENTQDFVLFLGGASVDHVEFSRDRNWIAYSTFPQQTIWRSRVDGSDRLQLSFAPTVAIFPRWSPDGKRIAFMSSSPGKAVCIYIVSAKGGEPRPLSNDGLPEIDPNWSPDGDSIMYARLPSVTHVESGRPRIETVNLKTRNVTILPGSEGLTAPRWSPDGRFVVATALSNGRWAKPAVVLYDFNTGKWTPLEDDPIDNKWWSADGKYFYFDKDMDNAPAVYRIRLSDRRTERLASLKSVRRSMHSMGWWMGVTPDGSPMVLRDTSIEEIYALKLGDR